MIFAAFPDYLLPHQPLNESYAVKLPSRTNRADFEQGMPRQRRTQRNAATQYQCTWPFTPDRYRLFRAFYDEVEGGQFTIPVFVDNAYRTVTAQFVKDSVVPRRQGGEWLVAAVVETMTSTTAGAAEVLEALMTAGTDESFEGIANLLHEIIHEELP
jgi:hypothetical protein